MRLLFQQSYCLLLWWLLMAQTQFWNMTKGCEGILPQGVRKESSLHNSRKLRKVVAIYKTDQLLSKKSLKKVPEKEKRLGKITLVKK